jgi:HTH-type transcriptional regulator/antitoxin HigA
MKWATITEREGDMTDNLPLDPRPPGKWVEDELEERGWTQLDLAEIIGRPAQLVSEIISGKRSITPETALGLADAFGTSPELWMNLETRYHLAKSRAESGPAAKDARVRRARLYTYPIREMVKRGWIEPSANVDIMEHQIEAFFHAPLDQIQHLQHAAKKSDYTSAIATAPQLAWLYRAKTLADALQPDRYSERALRAAEQSLRGLMHEPAEIRHVPRILHDAGVRFVVVEALPGSKIDGACFWLDDHQPVIAMSLRWDRIDNFWFVLRHEMEHVLRKDGTKGVDIIDIDIDEADPASLPPYEQRANAAAQEYCVSENEIQRFIARFKPLYSEKAIVQFAERLETHPGIVLGQLQKRGEVHWRNLRKLLVKVREFITSSALTDGWGAIPQLRA